MWAITHPYKHKNTNLYQHTSIIQKTIHLRLTQKKNIYYHKQGHETTNGANMFAEGKIQLLVQESKSHRAPWPRAYVR